MKPYTYLIGWPEHNTWYYGVRYATGCNPSDLWNPYTTSSKHVDAFVAEHGAPSVREIRRTFKNTIQARVWEERVLKRMKVVGNDRWLNKTDNKSIAPLYGKDHPHYGKTGDAHHCYGAKSPMKTQESRERTRQRMLSLGNDHWWSNPEFISRNVASKSGSNHHMKRPEVAEKVSGKNNWIFQQPGALEKRRQQFVEMNKARKGLHYRKVACCHCHNEFGAQVVKQHEKKCKSNLTSSVGNTDKTVYNNLVGSI